MYRLLIAAALVLVSTAGSVVRRQDDGNATFPVPDAPTMPPMATTVDDSNVVTTDAPAPVAMDNTTADSSQGGDMSGDTTSAPPMPDTTVVDVAVENTTQPEPVTTPTEADTTTTTTPLPCQLASDRIAAVFSFTQTPEFKELSNNEQIVVYELLAAGENCKMKEFITPETAERTFRLLTDLPLKLVYTFVSFVSESLANEGVVVPV